MQKLVSDLKKEAINYYKTDMDVLVKFKDTLVLFHVPHVKLVFVFTRYVLYAISTRWRMISHKSLSSMSNAI